MTFNQYDEILKVLKTPITKKSNRPSLLDYAPELRGPPNNRYGGHQTRRLRSLEAAHMVQPVQLSNLLVKRLRSGSRIDVATLDDPKINAMAKNNFIMSAQRGSNFLAKIGF